MNRREFIKKTGIAAAGSIAFPNIVRSGIMAKTRAAMAPHVVYVLFAGGVRQQEAVEQLYLAQSQNVPDAEGNIMYNMLNGDSPTIKIVYGTTAPGGQDGGQPIPRILQNTLQQQGTYFKEMISRNGGHFPGLSTCVSGFYGTTQGLQQRPINPTIFEYARKHLGIPASKVWFIGNGINNSTPLLNHSAHPAYGSDYGANFFAPTTTFGIRGETYLENFKVYHPEEELSPMRQMQEFLNQNFSLHGGEMPNLKNTDPEKEKIMQFVKQTFARKHAGQIPFPPVADNGDLQTIGYACEVMKEFTPTITVVNMSAVDSCHTSFTNYLKSLHRADHAVGHLWNYIQTQIPAMANNTILIAIPEHGRNLQPNPITDVNDWFAYDHDSDPNTRRIFAVMAGPGIDGNLSIGAPGSPVGNAADCVPTIAEILGFKEVVMSQGLVDSGAKSLFDYL